MQAWTPEPDGVCRGLEKREGSKAAGEDGLVFAKWVQEVPGSDPAAVGVDDAGSLVPMGDTRRKRESIA